MASATTKPQKRLREFLNEQQEPFILEVYLLERQYSKGSSLNGDSCKSSKKSSTGSSVSNKKRIKAVQQFSKVLLPALYSKLGFHNKESIIPTKDYDQRDKHVSVPEEGNSIWCLEDYNMFSSDTCRNASVCNMGLQRQRQRGIEDKGSLVSVGKIPLCRVPYVAAGWSLLGQSVKKEHCTMESGELLVGANVTKRVVHKTKKLLCVCEREITIAIPTKDDTKYYKQFMGQQGGDDVHVTNFLTLDYLNSITKWRNFEPLVKDICVEITDAILDWINYEVVSEMIETLANQPHLISS